MASIRDIVSRVPPRCVLPPATPEQKSKVRDRLGRDLPRALVEILEVTAGFDFEYPLSLLGDVGGQDLSPLCPHMLPIWEDGFGNSWGLDCDAPPADACRVLFACHDPPVLMFAAPTLAAFVEFAIAVWEGKGQEARVHEEGLTALNAGPGSYVSQGRAQRVRKTERAVVDLTHAKPGDGFWWSGEDGDFAARRLGSGLAFEVWRE